MVIIGFLIKVRKSQRKAGDRSSQGLEMQTMRLSASSAGMVFFPFFPLEFGERVRIGFGSRPHQTVFFHLREKILDCDCHQTELRGLGQQWPGRGRAGIPSLSAPNRLDDLGHVSPPQTASDGMKGRREEKLGGSAGGYQGVPRELAGNQGRLLSWDPSPHSFPSWRPRC